MIRWILGSIVCMVVGVIFIVRYFSGIPTLDKLTERAVPLGYKAAPEDIANGILWLASDESRYVTGTELVIDGGRSIG